MQFVLHPLSLTGLYYFYIYNETGRYNYLVLSCLVFAIAGSIKITAIISLFTLFIIYVLIAIVNYFKPNSFKSPFRSDLKAITIFFVISLLSVTGWWIYVLHYQTLHHTSYFLVSPAPIWKADKEQILAIWHRFDEVWMNHYFSKVSLIILAILTICSFLLYTRRLRVLFVSYFVFLSGCISYFMLFYTQFYVHDYYMIVILPLFVSSLFLFVNVVRVEYQTIFHSMWFRLLFLSFFIFNIIHAATKNKERIDEPWFHTGDHLELTNIEPYLDSIGVHQKDLVIYWGDYAPPNMAFYLMNRRGWGQWAMKKSLTFTTIQNCVSKGAKFLIVDQNQCQLTIDQLDIINIYSAHKIGDRDNIQVYSLL